MSQKLTQSVAVECDAGDAGSFTVLFDNLRARSNGHALSRFVFAGVSTSESTRPVTAGLARRALSRDLRVLVADLTSSSGTPTLQHVCTLDGRRADADGTKPSAPLPDRDSGDTLRPLAIDLRGGPLPARAEEWFSEADRRGDIVIVQGPPLSTTIDSAMLACACDGLVIVATAGATSVNALKVAMERTRRTGCRVLGLAVVESREWTPAWMSRLVPPAYS